ncbi:hypothetical protein [Lentzea californiensis]|uniref:hypothetical protein n=1 Tax=Lentzea californiensis TaxID=438851 RepID=UPI002166B196|nr:hypothetical protein [Lentzea californiensis]MCR3753749.1 hypothetical protein [Lentzea californiensis]
MSTVIGSDPDQLDQLAVTMAACADRLDGVRAELSHVLVSSPWQGGDAEDFRWQWGHHLAGMLQGASTAFREAGGQVRVNAAQQRLASADDGGGVNAPFSGRAGGGGGGGGGWPEDGGLLGVAAGFGAWALQALGHASGVADLVKTAHHGLLGKGWPKGAADQIVKFGDALRAGDSAPLRTAGKLLGKIAIPVGMATTAIDAAEFFQEHEKDPRSAATFSAGVSTVLGVAGVAAGVTGAVALAVGAAPVVAGAAVVGVGLFAGSAAWDCIEEHTGFDEWMNDRLWDLNDGVSNVAANVRDGVGDIINGGLNAVLGR